MIHNPDQPQKPAVPPPVFVCGRYTLALDRPKVMGIVNVTPDSFSDGGQFFDVNRAMDHARQLVDDGADILDIGGESTKPGAAEISIQEEIARVMPVVRVALTLGVPVSVDTRRVEVMRQVLAEGVDIINDVNGFRDPEARALVAAATCGVCVMHMQGEPGTMQDNPVYGDVVREVWQFLEGQEHSLEQAGVASDRILLDPGFGFGKTLDHNLSLLRALQPYARQHRLLVGLSRKRMIGALTHEAVPAQRLGGSVAAALWAAMQGAQVIRVHDVKDTVQALAVWQALGPG